ncbi:N-6 DNA methylase [Sphingobium sp. DC-2]|uniref:Eco57I restriction-modification methylase domain-containing protein n=1 Tax=Sphingobium sp. DC-2 TaxID=1303256 RepID=UPI0004C37FC7|nr:N-6 DNA methylase [Sphingobium sp. DC-2]
MARKTITDMSAWPSLSLEGNLIAPAMVAQIAEPKDDADTRAGYGIRKGLTIREEMSTAFRVGQSHFDAFAKLENPSVEATRRFVREFLKETFGFNDLLPAEGAVSFLAGGRVPIVVVPPADEKLDRRSATLSTDRSRSAAFALQDFLNDNDDALWGLVTNGVLIRLMRDNASLTRPAYIEADLAQIFANEDAASFSILWLMIHRSRFGQTGAPATDCALEHWRDAGSREGEAARERLADQVELALKCLGSGFLEANPELAGKLKSGEFNLTEWFNELLRLVYRLIFLMVAEDRNLLHPEKAKAEARKLYAEGYSLAVLRAQCFRAATWDKHFDRFEGVKILFKALAHGEERLALPALGGLFAEDRLPHLESARLHNKAFMEALYRLSWLSDKAGMVSVNWRAMETEELGSVYESLLELQPQLGDDGKTLNFASEAAEQKGNQRKTSGSYYTPDSLVQALLDTALDPVLDQCEAEADDPVKALLKLSVIDPACGSGHFLLAAARRIATRVARIRADGTPSLADFRHALRDVARSCLHGVDRNPMAVELTKVALWIETVDPGLPLGFFDAQIRCGDALLGVFDLKVLQDGIPDAAYKPLTGDDKDTAKYYLQANRDATKGQGGFDFGTGQVAMPEMKPLALDFSGFRDLPEDTVEQIDAKAKRFEQLRGGQTFARATTAADLYIAAFLLPKRGGAPAGPSARTVPTTEELWLALNQGKIREAMANAPQVARRARALHWPLEFPDVMQRGGFDVVLGNPPWEVTQVSDEEYFSTRRPDIAAMKSAARKRAIADLETDAPREFALYQEAKRTADAQNEFARTSGRFELSAQGKINTYALFSELSLRLLKSEGRAGIIVPAGIATDFFRRHFFDFVVREKRIFSALMFDNQLRIFPAVHPDTPFTLLTLCEGCDRPNFTSYILRIEELSDKERYYSLSRDEIAASNPNTRTLPIFRSRQDADLITKMYKNSEILIKIEGGVERSPYEPIVIQNFFTSSNQLDAQMFEEFGGKKDDPSFLPVRRGGSVFQFDHRYGAPEDVRMGGHEFIDADRFVPRLEVETRLAEKGWRRDWLLGWRDITNATNERTVISTVIPLSATDDTLSLLLPTIKDIKLIACLLANLNSLALDYAAQSKVGGTHIRKNTIAQFPVLAPAYYSNERLAFITPKVLELTYTSHSLAPFARDLGHDSPPFAWDEDRRAHLRADLDAFYARAYGLTRDELRYILDPADVKGPDYPSETFRVLKDKEIRQHGEYRTRRLVLAAWDRMETNGEFSAMGM